MTWAWLLLDMINAKRKGKERPRIYLSPEEYQKAYIELEPALRKRYGTVIVDMKAHEEGIENFLFANCPICKEGDG